MDFTLNRFALLTSASTQNNLPSSGRRYRKQYLKMSWNYSTPLLSSGDSVMLVLKAHDGSQLGIFSCRTWSWRYARQWVQSKLCTSYEGVRGSRGRAPPIMMCVVGCPSQSKRVGKEKTFWHCWQSISGVKFVASHDTDWAIPAYDSSYTAALVQYSGHFTMQKIQLIAYLSVTSPLTSCQYLLKTDLARKRILFAFPVTSQKNMWVWKLFYLVEKARLVSDSILFIFAGLSTATLTQVPML